MVFRCSSLTLSLLLLCLSGSAWTADSYTLIFSQAIWRHGDRTPQSTFPSDPIREDDWQLGGGGWGQLTPTGMRQHFVLGQKIRDRYINGVFNFLPADYNSKLIYVRATDRNRTLVSAMSNIMGMYSFSGRNGAENLTGLEIPGSLYPNVTGWPDGFVPIAVHTLDYDSDCTANIDCICPRESALQDWAHTLPEYVNYTTSPEVAGMIANLTVWTNETINADNYWNIPDTLLCERIYFNDTLAKVPWYSEDLYQRMQLINYRLNYFTSGVYQKPSVVNGLDVGLELLRIRSGPIVNELVDRMNAKLSCPNRGPSCSPFIQNLLYYAYSAHDETIYQVLAAFGVQDAAAPNPGEWPHYSAALLVELLLDGAARPYFQLMYRANETAEFVPLTQLIPDCNGNAVCPLAIFQSTADRLSPGTDIATLCQTIPQKASAGLFGVSVFIVSVVLRLF